MVAFELSAYIFAGDCIIIDHSTYISRVNYLSVVRQKGLFITDISAVPMFYMRLYIFRISQIIADLLSCRYEHISVRVDYEIYRLQLSFQRYAFIRDFAFSIDSVRE